MIKLSVHFALDEISLFYHVNTSIVRYRANYLEKLEIDAFLGNLIERVTSLELSSLFLKSLEMFTTLYGDVTVDVTK